jgi:hypothetical protein
MINLVRGQPYPYQIGITEGARAEFLRNNANTLQIIVPDMTAKEEKALRTGILKAGFLYSQGALLWLFRFYDNKGPLFTFDAPFDIRVIPADQRNLHSIDNAEQRLLVDIHIVDDKNIIRGLRAVTLPPELTVSFLVAVQEQLTCPLSGIAAMDQWQRLPFDQLYNRVTTWTLGT